MSTRKIGRNDPCPCGSGKKYKHCCMRKERRQPQAQEQEPIGPLEQIRYLSKQLMPHIPKDEAEELRQTLEQVEDLATYQENFDRIEAAAQALDAHRAEFDELMSHPPTAIERAHALFSEEPFAHLRYTVQDVQDTFEEIGHLLHYPETLDEEDIEILLTATTHLAGDVERRAYLARQLMTTLPDLVDAGRYLDGWLVQHSAYRTVEVPEESNLFLLTMFNLAFEEWTDQLNEQRKALMHELGIDASEVSDMDIEKMETLLKGQLATPEKKATLEAYYDAHPELRRTSEVEIWQLQYRSLQLFERDDADCLYLAPEEIEPWVPVLMERMKRVEDRAREATAHGDLDEKEIMNRAGQITAQVAREMAAAIFTPERIQALATDLKAYQRELLQKQDQEAVQLVDVVWLSLNHEGIDPAENLLLNAICFASLREMMDVLSEKAQTQKQVSADDETEPAER